MNRCGRCLLLTLKDVIDPSRVTGGSRGVGARRGAPRGVVISATGDTGGQYGTGALEGQYSGTRTLGGRYELGAPEVEVYVMVAWCGVGQCGVLPPVFTDGDTGGVAGSEACWLLPRECPPRSLWFVPVVDGHFRGLKCACVTASHAKTGLLGYALSLGSRLRFD